ncbi:MAG: tRNA (adenosine(37)-N6)-dimethylallyltransferase MiaA [Candidatus Omnitrophota bacterium]
MQRIIVIVGPTAIGKTDLAAKLAKKIKGEIISADSMQGYKEMDIISQKPPLKLRKEISHHLVDFLDPDDEYNAAKFARLAEKKIKEIIKRKKIPVIVGGSGLYVRALIDGIFSSPGKNLTLRRRLQNIASTKGPEHLHNMLKEIDPDSASKIHKNDVKKTIRAIEIYEHGKKTKTDLKKSTKGIKNKYNVEITGLTAERDKLYSMINKRVDKMFKKGIIEEARKLLTHHLSITSRQALGIKEIKGYLDNEYDIETAKELLKKNTRRFAKRQLTWFRQDLSIKWFDIDKVSQNDIMEEIWNGRSS